MLVTVETASITEVSPNSSLEHVQECFRNSLDEMQVILVEDNPQRFEGTVRGVTLYTRTSNHRVLALCECLGWTEQSEPVTGITSISTSAKSAKELGNPLADLLQKLNINPRARYLYYQV